MKNDEQICLGARGTSAQVFWKGTQFFLQYSLRSGKTFNLVVGVQDFGVV